eukprot:CAMPEP_0114335538 /NCGR_PEP_ID=MMETSP0101-20121206/5121_1 /TAXON_ID=38822 ORGANISM="Pteridomonas danica, Strain PT" /NCGR_SAMPLE_ID=MMETSP0101 /ASSEMBLY_ACC=CAM_ASM_000211 /LENGTH=88 /DNA_ID=CAMNT_0001467189 /DNA_START=1323 /DNA_END=1589 /DNA_ORIENTATION=+
MMMLVVKKKKKTKMMMLVKKKEAKMMTLVAKKKKAKMMVLAVKKKMILSDNHLPENLHVVDARLYISHANPKHAQHISHNHLAHYLSV